MKQSTATLQLERTQLEQFLKHLLVRCAKYRDDGWMREARFCLAALTNDPVVAEQRLWSPGYSWSTFLDMLATPHLVSPLNAISCSEVWADEGSAEFHFTGSYDLLVEDDRCDKFTDPKQQLESIITRWEADFMQKSYIHFSCLPPEKVFREIYCEISKLAEFANHVRELMLSGEGDYMSSSQFTDLLNHARRVALLESTRKYRAMWYDDFDDDWGHISYYPMCELEWIQEAGRQGIDDPREVYPYIYLTLFHQLRRVKLLTFSLPDGLMELVKETPWEYSGLVSADFLVTAIAEIFGVCFETIATKSRLTRLKRRLAKLLEV